MTRQTSIEAYNYLKTSGTLGIRQQEVYDVLFNYGPLTANEVFHHIAKSTNSLKIRAYSTNTRFAELRNMSLVQEVGKVKCSQSGRNVILWDVTSNMPVKFVRVTTKQKLEKAEKFIKDKGLKEEYEHNLVHIRSPF